LVCAAGAALAIGESDKAAGSASIGSPVGPAAPAC
jgi:hypothetical protein